jgi:hypothetical protein
LVLIYDDWHWADEASDTALKRLCGLIRHHKLIGDAGAKGYFERAIERAGPEGDLEARGLALQGLGQVKVFKLALCHGLELNQRDALLLSQLGTTIFHRVNALSIATMASARLGDHKLSRDRRYRSALP